MGNVVDHGYLPRGSVIDESQASAIAKRHCREASWRYRDAHDKAKGGLLRARSRKSRKAVLREAKNYSRKTLGEHLLIECADKKTYIAVGWAANPKGRDMELVMLGCCKQEAFADLLATLSAHAHTRLFERGGNADDTRELGVAISAAAFSHVENNFAVLLPSGCTAVVRCDDGRNYEVATILAPGMSHDLPVLKPKDTDLFDE